MTLTSFAPSASLIYLRGLVWSPQMRSAHQLRLALHTGSAETILIPSVLDELGYSPSMGESITTTLSASGLIEGYTMRVARFSCLGFHTDDYRVSVCELPEELNLQGVIGLSFLRQLNYLVRSTEGSIIVERAVPRILSTISFSAVSDA